MEQLGDILLRQRDVRGWTQERLAKACGVSRQQLNRYETGTAVPSWAVFKRILAVFRLQPRIELEPLDADVIAEIERQRRQPPTSASARFRCRLTSSDGGARPVAAGCDGPASTRG